MLLKMASESLVCGPFCPEGGAMGHLRPAYRETDFTNGPRYDGQGQEGHPHAKVKMPACPTQQVPHAATDSDWAYIIEVG